MMFLLSLLFAASTLFAQEYVGDTTCGMCHANNPEPGFFDAYMNSGHPWKIFRTAGGEPDPDTYPHSDLPPLPVVEGVQMEWSDVEYIVGNYFWKTRFLDTEGHLMSGLEDETTQWNMQTEEWVGYHAGDEDVAFNCGRCHTTGYDPEGDSQHGLPGVVGSWAQDGVRCEACHGPSSGHASNPTNVETPGGKTCSECHYRDSAFRMPWSGGFMKHHQQSEDLAHSPHSDMSCTTCHDPHRSVVYNDGGTTRTCTQCHVGNEDNGFYVVAGMESVSCKECHMPMMGKSANVHGEYMGDVRGHLFEITTDAIYAVDNVYEEDGATFWNQDEDGDAEVTLDYACMGCHIQIGSPLTLEEAADFADDIHTEHATSVREAVQRPATLEIENIYPNPFNPATTIRFRIDMPYVVRVSLYDMAGKEVKSIHSGPMGPGTHEVSLVGDELASGIYMVRITAGEELVTSRIALLK